MKIWLGNKFFRTKSASIMRTGNKINIASEKKYTVDCNDIKLAKVPVSDPIRPSYYIVKTETGETLRFIITRNWPLTLLSLVILAAYLPYAYEAYYYLNYFTYAVIPLLIGSGISKNKLKEKKLIDELGLGDKKINKIIDIEILDKIEKTYKLGTITVLFLIGFLFIFMLSLPLFFVDLTVVNFIGNPSPLVRATYTAVLLVVSMYFITLKLDSSSETATLKKYNFSNKHTQNNTLRFWGVDKRELELGTPKRLPRRIIVSIVATQAFVVLALFLYFRSTA